MTKSLELERNIMTTERSFLQSAGQLELFLKGRGALNSILDVKLALEKSQGYLESAILNMCSGDREFALSNAMQAFALTDSMNLQLTSLLRLNEFSSGEEKLQASSINCDHFFQAINKHYSVKCKSKAGLFWSCESRTTSTQNIIIDFELLKIVLSAAIDNAIQYTSLGFIKVVYGVHGNQLVVEVHDTGMGLSDDALLELTHKALHMNDMHGSTGFSFIKFFCKKLNGVYSVDSKVGFGTKLVFTIPVTLDTQEVEINPSCLGLNTPTTYIHNIRPNSFKVLVLESTAINLSHMERLLSAEFLRREDVQVTFTQDASEAIAQIEDNEFDLMFIDFNNKEMDILHFLKYVYSLDIENLKSKFVLLVEASEFPISPTHDVRLYCDKIFSKNIAPSDVRNLIRKNSLRSVI